MGHIVGLQEYLNEAYDVSIFNQALVSKQLYELQLHDHRTIRGRVIEDLTYDLMISIEEKESELLPKTNIKFLYPANLAESVRPLIKTDDKVRQLGLEPILSRGNRNHIKNKSLFPLMKEKRVLVFTLLEGEIIKGIVAGFSRYDVTLSLKGGIPVTILRHSVYDLRDKKGRSFLKSFQERHRDWEKTELFVSSSPG
jgi:hypothetical protein